MTFDDDETNKLNRSIEKERINLQKIQRDLNTTRELYKLGGASRDEVKKFRDWLVKQPSVKGGTLSSTTVNQLMIFLHKMFDVAVANRLRQDNPCNGLRKLPDKHKEMSYFTPEEFKLFDSLFTEDEYMFQLFLSSADVYRRFVLAKHWP